MLVLDRLREDRSGQDLIEYAFIGALIAVAVAVIFPGQIIPALKTIFSKVNESLMGAAG